MVQAKRPQEAEYTGQQRPTQRRANGNYTIMHNKFMVIDGKNVQTGSFNYMACAASCNAENALLIQDAPELAGTYRQEFNRLWNEASPPTSHY